MNTLLDTALHNNSNNRRGTSYTKYNSTKHCNKRPINRRVYFNTAVISCIAIFCVIFSSIIIVKANGTSAPIHAEYKYYTSIDIEKNDTLWSIANKYAYSSDNNTVANYVNDLKKINNISTDCIYQGQKLIVYYYSDEKQ